MGYYEGRREHPCPRCGGVVATLFISVGPMSFSQRCDSCGVTEYTEAEETQLGDNLPPFSLREIQAGAEGRHSHRVVVDRYVPDPATFVHAHDHQGPHSHATRFET